MSTTIDLNVTGVRGGESNKGPIIVFFHPECSYDKCPKRKEIK